MSSYNSENTSSCVGQKTVGIQDIQEVRQHDTNMRHDRLGRVVGWWVGGFKGKRARVWSPPSPPRSAPLRPEVASDGVLKARISLARGSIRARGKGRLLGIVRRKRREEGRKVWGGRFTHAFLASSRLHDLHKHSDQNWDISTNL